MRKKVFKKAAVLFSAVLLFGLAGCNKPVDTDGESDGKRIEVKAVVAGYGVDWLTAAAAKFNEVYRDEGYEVVITLTDAEINATNEIKTPNRCTTDIFFEYNNVNALINQSRAILKKDGVALLEDLSDVWNSPAVGADKKEHGEKIIDRIDNENLENAVKYTGKFKGFDGMYGMPWQGGSQGIYVNPTTLTSRGYSLDDLLTTDDFLAVVKATAPSDPLDKDAFFPVSWSGAKAPGYWDYLMQVLFAQYEGAQSYSNFWNFIPDEGTLETNGYTVYEKKGIYESLKVVAELLNRDYATPGTTSMDHVTAEARVAQGKSMFIVAGDYLYKELEKDYKTEMENIIAVKTPVISALGVKLDLCGAGAHEKDAPCAACNEKLRAVVKAVDEEKKTDEEIAAAQSVTAAKVKEIRAARGYYLRSGGSTIAFMPAYSDAKVGAKLFLRFLYSDDGMKIYRSRTYVDLPAKYVAEPEKDSVAYVQAMYEKMFSPNSFGIDNTSYTCKLREKVPMYTDDSERSIVTIYQGLSYSHSNGRPVYTPSSIYRDCIESVKTRWTEFLSMAGYGD